LEACSCDMFCPCYFNDHSTNHMAMGEHHAEEHFCRANLVLKVDKGTYKDVKLDGAKVWIATDLGSDWSTGKDSWLVVNFDPGVSKEQQAALADILGQLYPIPWQKQAAQTAAFSWNVDETECERKERSCKHSRRTEHLFLLKKVCSEGPNGELPKSLLLRLSSGKRHLGPSLSSSD